MLRNASQITGTQRSTYNSKTLAYDLIPNLSADWQTFKKFSKDLNGVNSNRKTDS